MNLAPYHKKGSAVASIFLGLTIANIVGVPITTWLGQTFDWRISFAVTAVLGVVAIVGIGRSLPTMPLPKKPNVKNELKAIMQPAALRAFATTVMCAGSMFTLYTYIAPIMQTLAQASDNAIAIMLALTGIGFTLGNYISGKVTDKSPDLALFGVSWFTSACVGYVSLYFDFSGWRWRHDFTVGDGYFWKRTTAANASNENR